MDLPRNVCKISATLHFVITKNPKDIKFRTNLHDNLNLKQLEMNSP